MPSGKGAAGKDRRFRRLESFSDALFAVAMTLLVFSFPISDLPSDLAERQVEELIVSLGTQFQTFIISFLVVGAFWIAHHDVFDRVTHYDKPLVWINFVFLLCIVFIPFPTSVMVDYGTYWIPVSFYAASIAAAGLMLALLWQYVSRGYRLIDRATTPQEIRSSTVRSLIVPAIFLSSIGVAYFAPRYAQFFWIGSFVVEWISTRLERRTHVRG